MSKWVKKIRLCEANGGWYWLVNENGKELTDRMQFNKRIDAIAWGQAWISSWANVELVTDEPQKN